MWSDIRSFPVLQIRAAAAFPSAPHISKVNIFQIGFSNFDYDCEGLPFQVIHFDLYQKSTPRVLSNVCTIPLEAICHNFLIE